MRSLFSKLAVVLIAFMITITSCSSKNNISGKVTTLPGKTPISVSVENLQTASPSEYSIPFSIENISNVQLPMPEGAKMRIGSGKLTDIKISPDGKQTSYSDNFGLYIIDSRNNAILGKNETCKESDIYWSPANNKIACSPRNENELYILDAGTGQVIQGIEEVMTNSQIGWSPDGKFLAFNTRYDGFVSYNVESELYILRLAIQCTAFAWSPDGNNLACSETFGPNRGITTLIDVANQTMKPIFSNNLGSDDYASGIYLHWSPDGKYLISHAWISGGVDGNLVIWDIKNENQEFSIENKVYDVSWSPDTKFIEVTTRTEVLIYDSNNWNVSYSYPGDFGSGTRANWAPNGKYISVLSNTYPFISIWDPFSGKDLGKLRYENGEYDQFSEVDWFPNSDKLLIYSKYKAGNVLEWDIIDGKLVVYPFAFSEPVIFQKWAPNGKDIAVVFWGLSDYTIGFWNVENKKMTRKLVSPSNIVAWSPDNNMFALREDDFVNIYSSKNGSLLYSLEGYERMTANQHHLEFSPDGNYLAYGNRYPYEEGENWWLTGIGGFAVWDIKTGKIVLQDRTTGNAVAWSPDGKKLATYFLGGTAIVIWENNGAAEWKRGQTITVPHTGSDLLLNLRWLPQEGKIMEEYSDVTFDNTVYSRIWDTNSSTQTYFFRNFLDYSENSEWFIGNRMLHSSFQIYDRNNYSEIKSILLPVSITYISWSPDGKYLATVSSDTLLLWDFDYIQNNPILIATPTIVLPKDDNKVTTTPTQGITGSVNSSGTEIPYTPQDFSQYKCPDKTTLKLRMGKQGIVAQKKVNLRSEPIIPENLTGNIIRVLKANEKFTVINGPICANSGTWWQIKLENDETGWAKEMDASIGWLLQAIEP